MFNPNPKSQKKNKSHMFNIQMIKSHVAVKYGIDGSLEGAQRAHMSAK